MSVNDEVGVATGRVVMRAMTRKIVLWLVFATPSVQAIEPPERLPQRPVRCELESLDIPESEYVSTNLKLLQQSIDAFLALQARGIGPRSWISGYEAPLRADLAQYAISTDQVTAWRATLEQLSMDTQARAAPDQLRRALNDTANQICAVLEQAQDIPFYWQQREVIDRVRDERRRLSVAAEVPADPIAEDSSLMSQLEQQATSGQYGAAIATTYQLIYALHMAEKRNLHFDDLAWPLGVGIPMTMRPGRCPAPVVKGKSAQSRAGPALPPSDPQTQRILVTEFGRVVLRIRLNTTGCVTHATVIQSSGFPSLDEIGVQMMFDSRFPPVVRRGAPVESDLVLATKFQIKP
jgi:TonB family protein